MLPALSESRSLRLTTVTAMYVAQGIQIGLLVVALPAYMASQGVSAVAIGGFISALILPWTLKMFYAPFMERYTFLAMGRRRPWVILGTLGGATGYFTMSLIADPLGHLGLLTGVMVAGSLFLALQDISTDALTIDVVPLDEQPRANGLMWGGKVLGGAGTAAGAGWLLNAVGVSTTLVVAGCVTAAFALVPILVRERPGERLLPWTAGAASEAAAAVQLESWAVIGRSLRRVLLMPASLLGAFVGFVMSMNQGFAEALGPVFTVQHLGWVDTSFSNMIAVAGLVGGLVGMIGGGLLVRWLGRARAIQAALLVLAGGGVAMGLRAVAMVVGPCHPGLLHADDHRPHAVVRSRSSPSAWRCAGSRWPPRSSRSTWRSATSGSPAARRSSDPWRRCCPMGRCSSSSRFPPSSPSCCSGGSTSTRMSRAWPLSTPMCRRNRWLSLLNLKLPSDSCTPLCLHSVSTLRFLALLLLPGVAAAQSGGANTEG